MNLSLEQRIRNIEDYQAILDLKGRYCNACGTVVQGCRWHRDEMRSGP